MIMVVESVFYADLDIHDVLNFLSHFILFYPFCCFFCCHFRRYVAIFQSYYCLDFNRQCVDGADLLDGVFLAFLQLRWERTLVEIRGCCW